MGFEPEAVMTRQTNADEVRMSREKQTITAMVEIFCRGQHATAAELCTECRELLDYALRRLDRCPFGVDKPTCARCPVHCYKPGMRDRVKAVMRYAGPRMLLKHPILAALHQWGHRRPPEAPRENDKSGK